MLFLFVNLLLSTIGREEKEKKRKTNKINSLTLSYWCVAVAAENDWKDADLVGLSWAACGFAWGWVCGAV